MKDTLDRLGAALIDRAALDAEGLARARRVADDTGERLDRVLTRLGLVPERRLVEALGAVLDLAVIGPADYPDDALFADRLGRRFLEHARVLPIDDTPAGVVLAMADPLDDFSRRAVEMALERPVVPCVAVPADLEAAIARLHGRGAAEAPEDAAETDVERLRDLAADAPVIRLVNQIIVRAVDQRASDIHIEPFETRVRVRYRVDGVLQEQEAQPRRHAAAILSRLKIMARLDIAERRLPQDGRLKLVVRGKDIDFRVATAPTLHGESVVLRILDWGAVPLDFAALGFSGPPFDAFLRQLDRPNGILLVTGPTGSGKTTTLYTALSRLNRAERKIVTVEDPIEYQLDGINQIQVKPDIGLGFPQVLRATLRHDPDVLMVGEIRDLETAQVAVQAALTGHLVLSTLHTNGAAASVSRLFDIGIEDYLLTSALAGIVAQRLVRRLCPACRAPYHPPPDLVRGLGLDRLAADPAPTLYRAQGCPACQGSGYSGRTGLYEVLVPGDALRAAMMARGDAGTLHAQAVAAGMRSLAEDGLLKVLAGETTLEEIWRVTRES